MTENKKTIYMHKMLDKLPILRKELGMSQSLFADIVGLSRSTITKIEGKKQPLTWNTFLTFILIFSQNPDTKKLMNLFGIYTDELQFFLFGHLEENESAGYLQKANDQIEILTKCSSILNTEKNAQATINGILREVAVYYKAERSFLFEMSGNDTTFGNTYEYCQPGIKSKQSKYQQLPLDLIETWLSEFRSNGSLSLSLDNAYRNNHPKILAMLDEDGVETMMAVPVFENDKLSAFIGVDNPQKNTEEWFVLKTVITLVHGELIKRVMLGGKVYECMNASGLVINEVTLPAISTLAEGMPGGFFIYNADTNKLIYFNSMMPKLFGCDSSDDFRILVNDSFEGIVYKDDFERVQKDIFSQINSHDDNNDHVEYRYVKKDGSIGWFDDYGHYTSSDQYGNIFYVFVNDTTEAHRLEEAERTSRVLLEEQHKLQNLVEAASFAETKRVGVFDETRLLLVDDDPIASALNAKILAQEGAEIVQATSGKETLQIYARDQKFDMILLKAEMAGMNGAQTVSEIRKYEKTLDLRTPIVALMSEPSDDLMKEMLIAGADDCAGRPVIVPELSRILIACMKEHSSQMEKKLKNTIRIANTDALTHVKNIAAYTDRMAELSDHIKKNRNYKFAIVLCDINNLKNENDTYGHDVGDLYIQNCCKIICDTFVHSSVYRIGGDEFAAVLQGTDYDNSERLMDQMKERVIESSTLADSQLGKASFATGIAYYNPEIDKYVSDTVKRADAEMYKNKAKFKTRS